VAGDKPGRESGAQPRRATSGRDNRPSRRPGAASGQGRQARGAGTGEPWRRDRRGAGSKAKPGGRDAKRPSEGDQSRTRQEGSGGGWRQDRQRTGEGDGPRTREPGETPGRDTPRRDTPRRDSRPGRGPGQPGSRDRRAPAGNWDRGSSGTSRTSRPDTPGRDRQPRRDSSPRRPEVPPSVTADQLDPQARAELRTLPADLADSVARWLVAASQEEDPETAYEYALQARRLAARVGVVRETCGVAAYRAGKWAEALAELRAARRLTGQAGYLPLMADCERGLGRPDRALAIVHDPGVASLDRATQIELRIVESGIRRDEGRPAAGVVALQVPELTDGRRRPWSARLFYAYADALLDAGRAEEARDWFGRAAALDRDEETDAADRFESLDSVIIEDLADPEPEPEPGAAENENPATTG
jgi:hypothetical protein